MAGNLYRAARLTRTQTLSRPQAQSSALVCLSRVSCGALVCRAPTTVRWQRHDGRAFLWPGSARCRTVERQPAVTAFVVCKAGERASLDWARASAAGDRLAVAGA